MKQCDTINWAATRPPFFVDVLRLTVFTLGFLIVSHFSVEAQDREVPVLFYNVENLFDTIDTPDKVDEEYTPSSELQHTSARYTEKLEHLAKVIDSSFAGEAPKLLGLCEVENRAVVEDLRKSLSIPHSLTTVHIESPDQRGIDNALLYDTLQFKLLSYGLASIDLGEDERPTRGVLWTVLNEQRTGKNLAVLVNHWPSRYGGQEASNWKRMRAAQRVVRLMDSLRQAEPDVAFLCMGDLNDYPDNESVKLLSTCDQPNADPCLWNTHEHYLGTDQGSHAYRGEWGVLDHILISRSLTTDQGWSVGQEKGSFVRFPWMMYTNEKDGKSFPSRFYGRDRYFGGYSDHLPARLMIHLPD